MMDLVEWRQRDLRNAAPHEAVQVVVAAMLGFTATTWLHDFDTDDPISDKLVGGSTALGGVSFPASKAGEYERPLISIAGVVAELLEAGVDPEEFEDLICMGEPEPSPRDLGVCPKTRMSGVRYLNRYTRC